MDEQFIQSLRTLAPGTLLREGLDNVLRARTGGLVVIGDTSQIMELVDGGFRPDLEFLPSRLYELAKMDGAIILSRDTKRILYANVQLNPDPNIPSFETGIRHRTAERIGKQTAAMVIAISQRRNVITFYQGTTRYVLRDQSVILNKANQALQTLEKFRMALDQSLANLTALELEDLVTVGDVVTCLQRFEMVRRVIRELDLFIAELGKEGRLVSLQTAELAGNVTEEALLLLQDYGEDGGVVWARMMQAKLATWSSEALLDVQALAQALGLGMALDASLAPRGYRVLHKIPRLPPPVVENLLRVFGYLPRVLMASIEEMDEVEGVGEMRARYIKEGLRRLREAALLGKDFIASFNPMVL